MKTIVALLTIFACLAPLCAEEIGDTKDTTRITLKPDTATSAIGDTIKLAVEIRNARNVGSVRFELRYDPTVLRFISPATEGSFLRGDGTNTVFIVGDTEDGGGVKFGNARLGGGTGASGDGTLAVLAFEAVADGSCRFEFDQTIVRDPENGELKATFEAVERKVGR